ncbi:MAG TPA: ABC transporter substrate-binding protein [Vicinamibacteria bacterium]|nr:ABC transporter substrate-binding protein [Vicinamibacteria bacterium]
MDALGRRSPAGWLTAFALAVLAASWPGPAASEDLLVVDAPGARRGGRLVVALRSEAKTFNPVNVVDSATREVIGRMNANLIAIDRQSLRTGPALARSWTRSADGRRYTLALRRGLKFSDGHPFDADDVVFTFEAYLDERNRSPQRDLLVVGGKPIAVSKVDAHTVVFDLEQPYAAAERLFDGISILPRHRLEAAHREGKLAQAWGLGTAPGEMAGLGPFRLKAYVPGERVVLERNPHYWKSDGRGRRLPHLDELVFLFVPSEDAQVIRFQAGETDAISRLSAENFAVLAKAPQKDRLRLQDLGPGLEHAFVFFNLNHDLAARGLASLARKQVWFKEASFRQAVSAAIDRAGIVRLVYQGRAAALSSPVSPGYGTWVNRSLPAPRRSLPRAREMLRAGGFTWAADGTLHDPSGTAVEFSIVTSSGNAARLKMATIVQDDLRQLGMRVRVVPLEQRAVIDRVLNTLDYEACVLALAGGDADPNVEMNVWLSGGAMHFWRLGGAGEPLPGQPEIDRLMREQVTTLDPSERKRLFDRVQELIAAHLPVIPLVGPHVLVGAKEGLVNLRPAVVESHLLWNADELGWREVP